MKLDELQKLCDEATPGPWQFRHYGEPAFNDPDETGFNWWVQNSDKQQIRICDHENTNHMNGKFIAASRTLLPKLLKVAKAAKVACNDHDLQCEDASGNLDRLEEALAELEKDAE